MENKTHWKQLVDPRYIGAYALPNGDDLTVTIERVQLETVTMMGGKKEDHSIMYIKGHKPMILNVTNSKSIHKLYGPFIEDWAGRQITLFASTAKMGGELVECLRIRPTVTAKKRKPIEDARFKGAVAGIKAGTYTVEKLRAAALLTDEQEAVLAALNTEDA
ncbi:hypothetical protein CR152_27710 [Massilia violaceinigra]|uniref:Uncharacterized protein n=1 Tax=Massilia violaceinigra TaxID=2045208 RepID=A0A2D2DSB7_9BURK|nr:hypothetical protein [Massilia violaceinigra]ATQ77866.1 hypothetical protein CR152_27710 [Massilia violaceinigra]